MIFYVFVLYQAKLFMYEKTSKETFEVFSEVRAGFEPAMTVLQTGALPLGYVTIYYTKKLPE